MASKTNSKPKQNAGVSLSEAISVLRAELVKAKGEKADGDPVLLVEEAEIELSLVLTHEGKAGGKVNWWVYEAGVEGTRTSEKTHTLRIKLKPLDEDQDAWEVRREVKSKSKHAEDQSG